MRRSRVARWSVTAAIVAFAACSTNHAANPAATTTTATSAAPPSSTRLAASKSPAVSNVQIVSLAGPTPPLVCNAPTQVELRWTTRHARSVTLRINGGPVFASYPNGRRDELVPLACDGNPQTYVIAARAPDGNTVTKSLTITERESNAS
jgi:hypothetical protein